MWLGKAVRDPDREVRYFHIGGDDEPLNSERPELTRALWKILADHGDHSLRVVLDNDAEFRECAGFADIGGDAITDISFEDYLDRWPG